MSAMELAKSDEKELNKNESNELDDELEDDELEDDELDDELDDDLDNGWIKYIEKEETLYDNFYREPNDTIKIFYTYINCENKIYYIKKDNIALNNNVLDK